jgi:hypothetical protein
MRRRLRGSIAVAVLATAALVLDLGMGLPDPGAAERAYGGFVGLVGCLLAMSWLRTTAGGGAESGRFSVGAVFGRQPEPPQPPVVEATRDLERALRLGAWTIGSFNVLVQPRLQSLATAKLARSGVSLGADERARRLLGEGFRLVDPAAPPPEDRMAPGVALHDVELLVETLERMDDDRLSGNRRHVS